MLAAIEMSARAGDQRQSPTATIQLMPSLRLETSEFVPSQATAVASSITMSFAGSCATPSTVVA